MFEFLGVIVGTLLSQLGTLLNSYMSSRKEEWLWHRQQSAEQQKYLIPFLCNVALNRDNQI